MVEDGSTRVLRANHAVTQVGQAVRDEGAGNNEENGTQPRKRELCYQKRKRPTIKITITPRINE